jgi:hypothetical protein
MPVHEPKPWCPGCEQDFHEHPSRPVDTLNAEHVLGKTGLDALFPLGSEWYYGPNYENCETRVRVIGRGAYTHGINYSCQPSASLAKDKPCWFIECEVISSPHRGNGYVTGYPPHTLIPAQPICTCYKHVAYVCQCGARPHCCDYPPVYRRCETVTCVSKRAQIDALAVRVVELEAQLLNEKRLVKAVTRRADRAEATLTKVREAVR